MKEFLNKQKPGVLIIGGIIIGALLLWISRGLITGSWNLYSTTPSTGAVPGGTTRVVDGTPLLRLSILPKGHLNTMNNSEKGIVARLFSQTNENGNNQTYIDQANRDLQKIGSALSIENNNPDSQNPSVFEANCKQGFDEWSLNLLSFTIGRCG